MSAFFEKLISALSIIVEFIGTVFKAIGRAILWVFRLIIHALSSFITWARYNLSGRAQVILLALIVALIVVGAALIFTGHGCSPASQDDEANLADQINELPAVTYTPDEHDIQKLNADPNAFTSFSLVSNGAQMYATLSEAENQTISEALVPYKENNRDVGFLIMNLGSGSGYCYNIDTKIYGASTYKGPFATYVCEELVDGGSTSLSSVDDWIENSITWSDNNSFFKLRNNYSGAAHGNWLSSMGIDTAGYSEYFPTYSVRESATLWMHMWNYLNSDSETAAWLKGLLKSTDTSFLRNGAEQAGLTNLTIYNKAGWCASEGPYEQVDGVNDAGIVVDGNQVYLVVAFSGAPDGPRAEANLANLFEALLSVRHNLDSSNASWDNVQVVSGSGSNNVSIPAVDPNNSSSTSSSSSASSSSGTTSSSSSTSEN